MLAPLLSLVHLVIRIDSAKVIVQTGANQGMKYVMLEGVDMHGGHIDGCVFGIIQRAT